MTLITEGYDMEQKLEQSNYALVAPRHSTNWIGGVVLIAIGAILLLQNFDLFHMRNWWALFLLIPIFGSLNSALTLYRRDGRFTRAVSGPLMGALVLTCIAAAFLFGINWGLVWPVFLIVGGLSILLPSMSK